MPDSRKRQRRIEKQPLKELRRDIKRTVIAVSMEYQDPPPADQLEQIARELFRFADPFAPGFDDAPVPSDRGDLRKEYVRSRLDDFPGTTAGEVTAELLEVPWAPSSSPPKARKAFRSVHRRKERDKTKTFAA